MAQVPELQSSLFVPLLGSDTKVAILAHLFPGPSPKHALEDFEDYFKHYRQELGLLQWDPLNQNPLSASVSAKTHGDIVGIRSTLLKEESEKRPQIRRALKAQFPGADDLGLNRSIDLTLRLWLMLNVRESRFKLRAPLPCKEFDDDKTLKEFITAQFSNTALSKEARQTRFHPQFTIANMVRICGLRVRWTPFLEHHLTLDRATRVIWIYPHKRCLAMQQDSQSLLPLSVLQETVSTLNLLFPYGDAQTENFLQKLKMDFHHVAPFERSLYLHNFNHWADRLLELHAEIYHAPPVSWSQLWADRRNPQQWFTFWIAFFILLLTLISTVATVVQAWAAVYALRLQQKSMN